MKTTLIFFVLISCAFSGLAQNTYVWKGGKPGRSNDWHCAANWSTYRVPDEFADVIIPRNTTQATDYPVIKHSGMEVNSLRISCGARVTIEEKGSLIIHNPDYCDDVSRIVVLGKLELSGRPLASQETVLLSSF